MIKSPSWAWKDLFVEHLDIRTADETEDLEPNVEVVPLSSLSGEELSIYYAAISLVTVYYDAPGDVEVVTQIDNGIGIDEDFHGLYDADTDKIMISRNVLVDLHKTVHVLLHELCHKKTGYHDCTPEFEQALVDIATDIILSGARPAIREVVLSHAS